MKTKSIPKEVTVAITSCGRLDLLQETLSSFRQFNTGGQFLLSEDSGDSDIIQNARQLFPDIPILTGTGRTGLMASIDRLYENIETPFIFHLEDDWQFDGPIEWESAMELLRERPEISNVCVRKLSDIKEKWAVRSDPIEVDGSHYRVMHKNAHPEFFGWSSNPGLIHKDLYLRYQPFSQYMHDQLSGLIKRSGQVMAYQVPGVAVHIGNGRNMVDPTMPPRPKSKFLKFVRKIKKDLYYWGLRKSPF